MRRKFLLAFLRILSCLLAVFLVHDIFPQDRTKKQSLDEKVEAFLESRRGTWRDMNVPESDGRLLYDLIVKNNYKAALEIGTSTGHSAIWIAWALRKQVANLLQLR